MHLNCAEADTLHTYNKQVLVKCVMRNVRAHPSRSLEALIYTNMQQQPQGARLSKQCVGKSKTRRCCALCRRQSTHPCEQTKQSGAHIRI
jgi:hypothetical protein